MPARNTAVLGEIVDVLSRELVSSDRAQSELERPCKDRLLTSAGDTLLIDQEAQDLPLAIMVEDAFVASGGIRGVETH